MRVFAFTLILLVIALAALGVIQFLAPRDASGQTPQVRFDSVVRDDFFAGLRGDAARLDKAMKRCEEELARDPRHAQALVWHGSGLAVRAREAVRSGDIATALELSTRGFREMDEAVGIAPRDPAVLLPRGITLSAAARNLRDPARAAAALEKAVADYETTLQIQAADFSARSEHARGELLGGLADGWFRLGNEGRARGYLTRIVAEVPGSMYAEAAREWLKSTPTRGGPGLTCMGCHE